MLETLEARSLWYKYKTDVWLADSEQTAVVHNIMRVLRAFRYSGPLVYVSVPITSGKFLYDLKLQRPLMDKSAQMEAAIYHNYHVGWEFVKELRRRIPWPILYPADLTPIHQHWEQAHFQALWLSIISEKCTEVHMSEGWEYSNGGSEEFVHAMQLRLGIPRHKDLVFFNTKETEKAERERMKNIRVYDHLGKELSIVNGIGAIEGSLVQLRQRRFEAPKLVSCLETLRWTEQALTDGFYQ